MPSNIVLLVVDSLRKKDLGGGKIASFLLECGEQGLIFHNYYSTASWTGPAHASIFSGQLPSEHGLTTENTYFQVENKLLTRLDNFHSVGLSTNGSVSESTGFDESFDRFNYIYRRGKGGNVWEETLKKKDEGDFKNVLTELSYFFKRTLKERDIASIKQMFKYVYDEKIISKSPEFNSDELPTVFGDALDELEEDRNSFVFMNISPVHYPYTFDTQEKQVFLEDIDDEEVLDCSRAYDHEEYLSEEGGLSQEVLDIREGCYLASIRYADRRVKELYEDAPDDTVFVVLGDHGELFGEYDLQDKPIIGHHFGTFKELIEVPLFIFSKSGVDLDIDESALYDHRDLIDIVSRIAGKDVEVSGRDLIRSEYFGLKGYYEQFDRSYPDYLEKIFSRKSFSIINEDYKFDLTSNGEYLWKRGPMTEEEGLDISSLPEGIDSKAEIFYRGRFN